MTDNTVQAHKSEECRKEEERGFQGPLSAGLTVLVESSTLHPSYHLSLGFNFSEELIPTF